MYIQETLRVFHASYNWKKLALLCVAAFIIRSATFYFYVQHEQRYHQADSMDYHNCALGIALGEGMVRLDTMYPIFWRVPGYPWYLSWFYDSYGVTNMLFDENAPAQKAAIWFQIILCSLSSFLVFFLSL